MIRVPKVARASQPWAERRYPVGVNPIPAAQRRRRDIFVENRAPTNPSSVRSGRFRPDGTLDLFGFGFYKDFAPDGALVVAAKAQDAAAEQTAAGKARLSPLPACAEASAGRRPDAGGQIAGISARAGRARRLQVAELTPTQPMSRPWIEWSMSFRLVKSRSSSQRRTLPNCKATQFAQASNPYRRYSLYPLREH
jgi:hypothetical protein